VEDQQAARASLGTEFMKLGWWGVGALVSGTMLLSLVWQSRAAWQWMVQAALLWAFACYQTYRRLDLNRPAPGAPLYAELGWGNRLTLLRAWLIAVVGGFLFQPWPEGPVLAWLPGLLYFCAAVLDRVDGYVARRTAHGSLLGNELDMVSDALGLAVVSLLAFGYGQVHWSYLLLGIAYYLFRSGIAWRKTVGLPVYPLPPAMHRRAWAGFQMGFLVAVLWPLFYPPVTTLAGFAFMLPALVGFVVDWLIVSGRIDRQAEPVDRFFRRLAHFSYSTLQPALRVAVPLMLAVSVGQTGLPLLPATGANWSNEMMAGGMLLAVLLVLLGIAGRAACLMLIGLLGWYYSGRSLLPVDYVLFCSVVWLMLLGTGRFSLWQADDHWINRYDGT
jgi:CDP-diacylglycerol--glycerol-3-phosphate 3-phosphatidyltransferase